VGEAVTGSEFERIAGRETSKKWKESVRMTDVLNDKNSKLTAQQWLEQHAVDLVSCTHFHLQTVHFLGVRIGAQTAIL